LLPHSLLSLESQSYGPDASLVPRYLTSRDEVWVGRAMQEFADMEGETDARVHEAWQSRIEPALRKMGARKVAVLGIKSIVDRMQARHVSAAADPRRIREVVFESSGARGGRPRTRGEILECAANALLLSAKEVEDGLFADRASARKRGALPGGLGPSGLVERYNLALVQGILLRAKQVTIELRESIRAVVRYAKLRGLLAEFSSERPETIRAVVSGPLSLFRNTLKYGRALATFFPTLVAAPFFSMRAECVLPGGPGKSDRDVAVFVDHTAPIPRHHAIPKECDSSVERALVRELRKSGTGFTLHRETTVLRAGTHLVFPDFALRRGQDQVLVEVVGYYTKEYIERKTAALRAAAIRNLIVCVDTDLDCGKGAFGEHVVVPFRKRIDVARLLEAATRMLDLVCSERRFPLDGFPRSEPFSR
jgi:uncharacterized protein